MSLPERLSVIVPVRDEKESLPPFLQALREQDRRPDEIIFVDTGSVDGTLQLLREEESSDPRVKVLSLQNAMPGAGRNAGFRESRFDPVCFLDLGCLPDRSWLSSLATTFATEPGAQLVFGVYRYPSDSFFRKCASVALRPNSAVEGTSDRFGPTAASFLITRDAFQKLSGFREDLRSAEDLVFFEEVASRYGACPFAVDAAVTWLIPDTFTGTFRKYYQYSLHTLRADLSHTWHRSVQVYYGAATMAAIAASLASPWGALLLLGPIAGRTLKYCLTRSPSIWPRLNPARFLTVGAILTVADAALAAGSLRWAISAWRKGKAG